MAGRFHVFYYVFCSRRFVHNTQLNRVMAKILLSLGFIAEKYLEDENSINVTQLKPYRKRTSGIPVNDIISTEQEQRFLTFVAKKLMMGNLVTFNPSYESKYGDVRRDFFKREVILPQRHWESLLSENKKARLSAVQRSQLRTDVGQKPGALDYVDEELPPVNVSP
jgi:hypothetical protein